MKVCVQFWRYSEKGIRVIGFLFCIMQPGSVRGLRRWLRRRLLPAAPSTLLHRKVILKARFARGIASWSTVVSAHRYAWPGRVQNSTEVEIFRGQFTINVSLSVPDPVLQAGKNKLKKVKKLVDKVLWSWYYSQRRWKQHGHNKYNSETNLRIESKTETIRRDEKWWIEKSWKSAWQTQATVIY